MPYNDSGFNPTKWISKRRETAAKKKKKPASQPFSTVLPTSAQTSKAFLNQRDMGGTPYDPRTLAMLYDATRPKGVVDPRRATTLPIPDKFRGPGDSTRPDPIGVKDNYDYTKSGGGEGSVPKKDWEGFAGDFSEIGMPILYDNPELISNEVLKNMGFNSRSGMMDLAAERAQDLQYLAMMTLGMGGQNSNDPDDFLNFANETIRGMMDPGGKGTLDSAALIQRVLDAPQGSALKGLLETGDPQQQAAILNNLIMAASGSKTPLMQRAMQGVLEDRSNQWLTQNAKGSDVGFLADWLQRGGKGIFGP